MRPIQNYLFLLLLAGLCAPSYAAIDLVGFSSCSVFSADDDKKQDESKESDEEPDCE